jgi:hypothetical protein
MKKVLKFLVILLEIILITYVIIFTTFLLCKNKFNYTQFGENTLITVTAKNQKEFSNFNKGDLVIIKEATFDEVKVGGEIYYYDTINQAYVIRVGVVTEKSGDEYSYLVKIDTNEGKDRTISADRLIGIYADKSYESVGGVIDLLTSRIGFLLLVILPILLLFIYHIYNLVYMLKTSKVVPNEKAPKKDDDVELL